MFFTYETENGGIKGFRLAAVSSFEGSRHPFTENLQMKVTLCSGTTHLLKGQYLYNLFLDALEEFEFSESVVIEEADEF